MRVRFPWPAPVWAPTETQARRAERAQVYTVRVRVTPEDALEAAWAALAAGLGSEGDALLDGGAALRRAAPDLVEAWSGGEDVLDSLSWTVNQTLLGAVRAVAPQAHLLVVAEEPALPAD